MRPSKCTWLGPGRAVNLIVPAATVRVQRGRWRLSLVGLTQRCWALRPGAFFVNANATVARWLRVNEKVVPPRAFPFCLLMMLGSLLPSRHLLDDSRTEEMTGAFLRAVENTDTLPADRFAVARRPRVGLNATDAGYRGVENGEPGTALSAPVLGLTENTDTLLAPKFAVASKPPPELNATELIPDPFGSAPSGSRNGEPATALSAPVFGLTENTDTLPTDGFAVATRPPPGLNATDAGPPWPDPDPVENGEPATALNAPVLGLTENTDTLLAPKFAVASRPPPGLKATELAPGGFENGEPVTALNAPVVGLTENTDTSPGFAVASRPPPGLKATDADPWLDPDPVENGEPATALNAPVLGLTEETETMGSVMPVIASRRPSGLNATEVPLLTPPNGEPVTALSAPVLGLTENSDTSPKVFAVATRPPLGLNATAAGPTSPVANGEPGTCANPSADGTNTNDATTTSASHDHDRMNNPLDPDKTEPVASPKPGPTMLARPETLSTLL